MFWGRSAWLTSSKAFVLKTEYCIVYKPACNGQAEGLVQILKQALQQVMRTGKNPDKLLLSYLLMYCNTPHTTTGESPAMLLYGRRLRTRSDVMLPSVAKQIHTSQTSVRNRKMQPVRSFPVNDAVLVKKSGKGEKWLYDIVVQVLGGKHYKVKVQGDECIGSVM